MPNFMAHVQDIVNIIVGLMELFRKPPVSYFVMLFLIYFVSSWVMSLIMSVFLNKDEDFEVKPKIIDYEKYEKRDN